MGLIPQHFIHELLARVDIVDLIDSRIPLKKAGANYKACCPFHGEKTPSFTVSQDKQFYHCFGCGAHGNAIGFIMEYDRLEFPDAVEELATSLGIDVPREDTQDNRPKVDVSLYDIMAKIAEFYQQQLKTEAGKVAVEYLKNRGLSGEIAKQYGIGFVANEWNSLEKIFTGLRTHSKLQKQLLDCGMLIKKEDSGSLYDRFRDRIMFPIKDKRGRIIAFGGRVLGQGEPKYLNSPETPIFHKSNELYGLYEARQANRKLEKILIVEGYMDVVALAQYGITNAVATLGTATTSSHLQQLFRVTRELVLCFDGDRAGREAALRALEHALPQLRDGREIRLMFLPDGEDPDSMVRKIGQQAFENKVRQALPVFDFLLKYLEKQVDLATISGKGQMLHLAKPYLDKISDPIYHEIFSNALAAQTGLPVEKLKEMVSKPQVQTQNTQSSPKKTSNAKQTASLVSQTLALLLNHPQAAYGLDNYQFLQASNNKGWGFLFQIIQFIKENQSVTTGMLLENYRNTKYYERLSELAKIEVIVTDKDNTLLLLKKNIQKMLLILTDQRINQLVAKDKNMSTSEKREYLQLLGAKKKLKEKISKATIE